MIHTANLKRQADLRIGTLDLGHPLGTYELELRRGGDTEATLRVKRDWNVWTCQLVWVPPEAFPEPKDGYWHGDSCFGLVSPWRYRIRGVVKDDVMALGFDDSVVQPRFVEAEKEEPWTH